MWIPSKFNVLYLLVALMSIEQGVSASKVAEATQDLCKNKDRDDFNLTLRATLLFRNTLILIDEGWLVYKIAHSNINNSYSQLMIDVLGKPLEEEWPAFKDYPPWKDIKPNVLSIFHVDIKTPFLYMAAKGINGVRYNLDTKQFYENGRPGALSGEIQPLITDSGLIQFRISMAKKYCIYEQCMKLEYGNVTWDENGEPTSETVFYPMGYMYYTWNRTTPTLKNITVIDERVRKPSKYISRDFDLGKLDWNLPTGFVYEGNFQFFAYKNVFIFPVSPLKLMLYPDNKLLHASHPLNFTKVKDYFHCVQLNISGKTFPPEEYTLNPGTVSNGNSNWIWIVVAVILVLLIVAIIALLFWYFALGPKSLQSKSKGKTSSEALFKNDTTATVKQDIPVNDKKK